MRTLCWRTVLLEAIIPQSSVAAVAYVCKAGKSIIAVFLNSVRYASNIIAIGQRLQKLQESEKG